MRYQIRLVAGSKWSKHQFELFSNSGTRPSGEALRFALDGKTGQAQAEEISRGVYSILLGHQSLEAHVSQRPGKPAGLESPFVVAVGLRRYEVEIWDPRRRRRGGLNTEVEGPREILAPMPGKIVRLLVGEDQEVKRDQGLMVVEAMKMQNELRAPRPGRVERIFVKEGAGVEAGERLLRLA